jgi:hypothetical protein
MRTCLHSHAVPEYLIFTWIEEVPLRVQYITYDDEDKSVMYVYAANTYAIRERIARTNSPGHAQPRART